MIYFKRDYNYYKLLKYAQKLNNQKRFLIFMAMSKTT